MKKAEDFYIKLEKRAYQTIDKIENGRDQSAKYEYLEIMTMVAFFSPRQPAHDPLHALFHGGPAHL